MFWQSQLWPSGKKARTGKSMRLNSSQGSSSQHSSSQHSRLGMQYSRIGRLSCVSRSSRTVENCPIVT